MNKAHKQDAEDMYNRGHTFYAITYQIEMWYHKKYTPAQIHKALGKEDNKVGR